ncbi:uncharacterized protein BT62DRAFT_1024585 [Guyanagaster necrorhizus]|uniref:Protein kinase domain-containing protein n=1 Tax=Guyanagaster necrorhizus TaxID=856835 RepID=A0A9P7VS02_9AGAR|nr:uncharacterized protein BT62DRAFT_1024585 [Guyanagaster necrorhizus MCA 3950]KAG7445583.1 hypothetical protein BT62DRAFT_1024585 [Guyanagaster necrorhizus MCA 3950]
MPRLRQFYSPSFDTVGELIECFRQVLDGVEFLHRHFVAHRWNQFFRVVISALRQIDRDVTILNIMLDASELYPKGFHPATPWMNATYTGSAKHITRTECWSCYFIIDFGVARRYEPVSNCGNRYVPEYKGSKKGDRCNPFPTGIFCFGKHVGGILLPQAPTTAVPCPSC